MKKIVLSITRDEFKILPEKAKLKLLNKNNNKCTSCSIDIDNNIAHYHTEGKLSYPLCSLCYYPLHLERLTGKDPGKIIMFEELTQVELNSLLRAIYFIKNYQSENEEAVDAVEIIETVLKERTEMADVYYASGVSNIDLIVQKLYGCSEEDYNKRENGLYALRWMPNVDNFKKDMDFWAAKSFAKYTPNNWQKLILSVAKKTN
jgi:hypothetical protein